MLKLVGSHELEIHSFLSSVKSRDNHTIPILHEIALNRKTVVVMPDELVLRYVANSVFETSGADLASQFLAGVRFMHHENVAHLDLKPDNVLVTLRPRALLRICDYDISVRVAGPESWTTGYRGTPGWAAPEISKETSKPYQPIRADLWSTGRVLEYIAYHQPAYTIFRGIIQRLLHRDPLQRPDLSKICLPYEGHGQLKRKASVEKGEVKRRRKHPGYQVVVPNILASAQAYLLHNTR